MSLTWSLTRTPQGLRVEYQVRNPNPAKIWVCDQLVVPVKGDRWTRSDRVTVSNSRDGKGVVFSLGPRGNDLEADELYRPTFVELGPNEERKGSFTVPLPLASWSPENRMKPLAANHVSATLDIYYLPTEPAGWAELNSPDATPLRVPAKYTSMMQFSAGPLPIPQ